MVTPYVLTPAVKKIGEFDKVENGYTKYYGTSEWTWKHWYTEVTVGDETRSYTFCPFAPSGYMETVPKINFGDASKFVKIY